MEQSLIDGGYWERGTMTVPDSVSDERVQFHATGYMRKFGEALEKQGLTVKKMTRPVENPKSRLPKDPDRRRYSIYAWVTRTPLQMTVDIPDLLVPKYLSKGWKLN